METQKTTLKQTLIDTFNHPDDVSKAKKSHAIFLRESLVLPVEKAEADQSDPIPLYIQEDNAYFLPVFSEKSYYDIWAGNDLTHTDLLHLTGNELVKGCGENVYICLDIGQRHYKQFSPEEVNRLKMVVSKLDSLLRKNKK